MAQSSDNGPSGFDDNENSVHIETEDDEHLGCGSGIDRLYDDLTISAGRPIHRTAETTSSRAILFLTGDVSDVEAGTNSFTVPSHDLLAAIKVLAQLPQDVQGQKRAIRIAQTYIRKAQVRFSSKRWNTVFDSILELLEAKRNPNICLDPNLPNAEGINHAGANQQQDSQAPYPPPFQADSTGPSFKSAPNNFFHVDFDPDCSYYITVRKSLMLRDPTSSTQERQNISQGPAQNSRRRMGMAARSSSSRQARFCDIEALRDDLPPIYVPDVEQL